MAVKVIGNITDKGDDYLKGEKLLAAIVLSIAIIIASYLMSNSISNLESVHIRHSGYISNGLMESY